MLADAAPLAESVGAWFGWASAGKYISGETSIPMAFDAVMVYYKAIYDLEMNGTEVTRESLMNAIPNVVLDGVTGTIQFDENCDRGVEFELINLRDDLPVVRRSSDVVETHDWHSVATWTPPADGESFGSIELNAEKLINWGTGLDNLGVAPPDYMEEPSVNEDISKESLLLIAIGSVAGVLAIGFFIRFMRKHHAAHDVDRFDANKEQQRRVLLSILKSLFAFALEIGDYVSDALSASSVFALMGEDVISPVFVILYLCIICIGGVANFGNCIARAKNFMDLIKEYNHGVSMHSGAGHDDAVNHDDSTATALEVNLLRQGGFHDDVEKLESLSVKSVEVRRSIRIEKFTFMLGFVEDLPITIMNSILLMKYRDDINYEVIYVSTLITLLEFGMKSMSIEKIFMLNSELKYLKEHSRLQRKHSVSKAKNREVEQRGSSEYVQQRGSSSRGF